MRRVVFIACLVDRSGIADKQGKVPGVLPQARRSGAGQGAALPAFRIWRGTEALKPQPKGDENRPDAGLLRGRRCGIGSCISSGFFVAHGSKPAMRRFTIQTLVLKNPDHGRYSTARSADAPRSGMGPYLHHQTMMESHNDTFKTSPFHFALHGVCIACLRAEPQLQPGRFQRRRTVGPK